jgi:iron(III) transport system substrate-binding protein
VAPQAAAPAAPVPPPAPQTVEPPVPAPPPPPPHVTIYTSFDPARLKTAFADFTKASGIDVAIESDEPDLLLGRLLTEGAGTPADLVLLPNLARFDRAATAGLFQPLSLPELERAVPAAYATQRVKPGEIQSYQDLARPKWYGKVCLPTLSRLSNRTLVASIIHHMGPAATEVWARALILNGVRMPAEASDDRAFPDGDDRALLKALASGTCDVAIISSRTVARLGDKGEQADKEALDKIGIVWPNQAGWGTMIDIIGVGIPGMAGGNGTPVAMPSGDHGEAVVKALTYIASDTGQRLLAEAFWAYPIKPGVPLSNPVTRWGPFKADTTPLATFIPIISAAASLTDQVGWP